MTKILFQNGMVVDGTGAKPYQADVLVQDDKIVKIGKIEPDAEMQVIDAKGLAVAPGFIDTHSHSDLQILVDPEVKPKVMQGITTEILGQDGISMAPLPGSISAPGERTWLAWMATVMRSIIKKSSFIGKSTSR